MNTSNQDIKDALFALRYGTANPIPQIQEDQHMLITLNLTLADIEEGRIRATIASDNGGVYAEASDAQTAAAQAVKSYLVLHRPATVVQTFVNPPPAAPRPRLLGRQSIRLLMEDLANSDTGRARIEYEDADGHQTTRTIEPKAIEGDRVVAYDHLRGSIRTFKLAAIKSAQEVA